MITKEITQALAAETNVADEERERAAIEMVRIEDLAIAAILNAGGDGLVNHWLGCSCPRLALGTHCGSIGPECEIALKWQEMKGLDDSRSAPDTYSDAL